jgi:hypothetical protein
MLTANPNMIVIITMSYYSIHTPGPIGDVADAVDHKDDGSGGNGEQVEYNGDETEELGGVKDTCH